jgi:hypothetical protein
MCLNCEWVLLFKLGHYLQLRFFDSTRTLWYFVKGQSNTDF